MGFIFRAVFWLGLAVVILPPQARLGGDDTADFDHVDVGLEFQNAVNAAWSLGSNALRTCETNPELCKAGVELWNTTVKTGVGLAGEVQKQLQAPQAPPLKTAAIEHADMSKIQARVE
ncbi:MAG: hypothetical protein K8S25_05940 [Alphaproteobacteria bacterium]|nr:hypothetical protein [Alphaproteobacteria bacterium]